MLRRHAFLKLAIPAIATFAVVLFVSSCTKKNDDANTEVFIGDWKGTGCNELSEKWTEKASFPGVPRNQAAMFAYGNDIYLCAGGKKRDFWRYVPADNSWTLLGDVPGTLSWRQGATSFVIGNTGYVAFGMDISNVLQRDLWAYDVSTNVWNRMADLATETRKGAFAFVIGDTAYIGGGTDGSVYYNDLWAFVPRTNTWYKKKNIPARVAWPMTFTLNDGTGNRGFLACGINATGETNAVYKYDAVKDEWQSVAPYPSAGRYAGVSFVLDNKVWAGTGMTGTTMLQDLYVYDAVSNKWSDKTDYPGGPTAFAVAAAVNGKGYLGTGGDAFNVSSKWFEYRPRTANKLTYKVTSGPNNYSVYLKYNIGEDTCLREISLLGEANSNSSVNASADKYSFSISNQNTVDRCGESYTISGSGVVKGDSIFITTLTSSVKGLNACTFRGAR